MSAPVLARRQAFPAFEGVGEVRHFAIAQALGNLFQGQAAGGEQFLGQGLTYLFQQLAKAGAFLAEVTAQAAGAGVQLRGNLVALLGDLQKAKPATSKGIYLKRITISSTMGPGVKVEPSTVLGAGGPQS